MIENTLKENMKDRIIRIFKPDLGLKDLGLETNFELNFFTNMLIKKVE